MKSLPFFKWYPADAETDANFRAMDDADIGFYIRCLNHAWINGSIPADPKERARVLRTRLDTANRRWERVGKCFVISTLYPDSLINLRQEKEREHATSVGVTRSESAKASSKCSANAQQTTYTRARRASVSVSGSPSESEKTKEVIPCDASLLFPQWWERYPLKDGAQIAAQIWISLVTTVNEAAVFACLDRYMESDQVLRGIVKKPNNWLHDCARDNWATEWPRAVLPTRKKTVSESIESVFRERALRGEKII